MLEDIAVLITYLIAGAFPVAYNYAIARRLAKKYGIKVITNEEKSQAKNDIKLSSEQLKCNKFSSIFKIENVSFEDGRLHLSLILNEEFVNKIILKVKEDKG